MKKQKYSDDDSDFDEQEAERLKDLKERDEFADRMKSKDKEKTRQIMSKSEKKVIFTFKACSRLAIAKAKSFDVLRH